MILSYLLSGQEEIKWHKGFGIEEGIGYNTCYGFGYAPGSKNTFLIQPTGRIFYSITLRSFSDEIKFKLPVFIGYYTFGSKTKNDISPDNFDDYQPTKTINLFHSIEAGINPCIERNNFQLGWLLKGQYIFSVRGRMYMVDGLNPPFWREEDISSNYKSFAMNTGIKLKYKLIEGVSIACEMWFGITNLYVPHPYGSNGNPKATENNYRIVIGFEL